MNLIETKLAIQNEEFYYKLPILTNLYGLRCEIYYPLANNSHYQNSSKFNYPVKPNEIKQLLVTNQFEQVAKGDNIYDPFSMANGSQPELIVRLENKLKDNCKVTVYKGSSYTEYRVDVNSTMVMGLNNNPLYIRYKLIPVI